MKTKNIRLMALDQITTFPDFKKFFPPLRRIINKIKESIKAEGFRAEEPIVVWRNPLTGRWYIVDGHQRYLAAKELRLVEVWVAIVDTHQPEEVKKYMIDRQMVRRQVDAVCILNALANAQLYRRGGRHGHESNVPNGTLNQTGDDNLESLEQIGEILGKSRRTIARVKRQYFDQLTPAEKGRLKTGDLEVEDAMKAIDDRRPKTINAPIHRYFSQIGLKNEETEKLMAKAEEFGMSPRCYAAEILREALAGGGEEVADSPAIEHSEPTPKHSIPQREPVGISPDRGSECSAEPLTVSHSSREVLEAEAADTANAVAVAVAKDKEWKGWNPAQRNMLFHFHAMNPQGTQVEAVRAYREFEGPLRGANAHSESAVTHALQRLICGEYTCLRRELSQVEINAAAAKIRAMPN